jgi:hypothetical protein
MTPSSFTWKALSFALAALATITASKSVAASLTIENPSFENPVVPDGSYVGSVPGWSVAGTAQIANPANNWFANTSDTGGGPNPIDGRNAVLVNSGGSISQQLTGVTIEPNQTYTLILLAGQRSTPDPFGTPSISFQTGNQILAQTNLTAPGSGLFATYSLNYTAPSSGPLLGAPLKIVLQSAGPNAQAAFDYIRVTTAQCTPKKAKAVAQVVNGFVVGASITDPGCGYTNAPIVVIEGGGGSGATARATVLDGIVTSLQIVNPGCCYTNVPRIVISAPPTAPTIQVAVSRVKIIQNVVLGWKYILEASTDGVTWAPVGPEFTAVADPTETEVDASGVATLYRLRVVQ